MKKLILLLTFASITPSLWGQIELNEVVVISTRSSNNTPVAHFTMKVEDIQKRNIRTDVPNLIELTPSVVTSSESGISTGNTSFRIRGSDPTRTNITLDGIPLNRSEPQVVFWANMPGLTNSLNSIQIQRGVGSSSNGPGAFGATVSLQSALPSAKPYAEFNSTVGSYNTFDQTIRFGTGILSNSFRFDARYSKVQSDGYIERSWSRHQGFFLSGAWSKNKTLIKGLVMHGDQHTGISWDGVPGYAIDSVRYLRFNSGIPNYNPGINRRYNPAGEYLNHEGKVSYYNNESDNHKQTQYILQTVQGLGKNWKAAAVLHLMRGRGYFREYHLDANLGKYDIPNMLIGKDTISSSDLVSDKVIDEYFYGGILTINYSTPKIQWTSGGASNLYRGKHFGTINWLQYNSENNIDKEWYRNFGVKNDYNVYSKVTWKLNKLIDLYTDLQYRHVSYTLEGPDADLKELDQKHYFNFFNPKAGLFLNLSARSSGYLSVSIANREPSRTDFKDAPKEGAKIFPRPERLFDTEIGYKYSGTYASWGVNLYYMLYKDQLIATGRLNNFGFAIMENVEHSYRSGIELMGAIKLNDKLRMDANMTLSRNKIHDLYLYTRYCGASNLQKDYYDVTDIPFSPALIGGMQLSYELQQNLTFRLMGKYVGEQYYDNTSSESRKLDDYFLSSFQSNYSIKIGFTTASFSLLLNNILDKKYISSAWVNRKLLSDEGREYVENGFFPQAGRHVLLKLSLLF